MKKLIIWGIGSGLEYFFKLVDEKTILKNTIAFVDSNRGGGYYRRKLIINPSEINKFNFDAILVTATRFNNEIKEKCLELGIPENKIIFINNSNICGINDSNIDFIKSVLGENVLNRILTSAFSIFQLNNSIQYIRDNTPLKKVKEYKHWLYSDNVRISEFEFAVKEIRKRGLKGNCAELGVFRGEFAQFINAAFPDRKLYLFDTFESFDKNEAAREKNEGLISNDFIEYFKDTSIQRVLDRMVHKDSVVIQKGFFPDSLNGLEESFCFVSLDVDLEKSIYDGLDYFYPRLEKGGYIFVHDYANIGLPQVEKAVDNFEKNIGFPLCKLALCDSGGTLVITK